MSDPRLAAALTELRVAALRRLLARDDAIEVKRARLRSALDGRSFAEAVALLRATPAARFARLWGQVRPGRWR